VRLLISDANILIDLEDAELTALLFRLPFRVMAPDLLYFDELAAEHPHLIGMGLELGEVKPAAIAETQVLVARYRRPSRNDCLALALAKQEHCPLATGDRDLAEAARAEAVPVVGTIWLIERMVLHGLIVPTAARDAYERMRVSGRRLPWQQAEQRLREIEAGTFEVSDPFQE